MNDLRAIRVIEGTKISHDYMGQEVVTFGLQDLIDKRIPAIGIPAKQNGLVIVDVDIGGAAHKHDGRAWWKDFASKAGIPPTYTVQTASGGYHFYYKIPEAVNPETFKPPGELSKGVDVIYNGWCKAPPTRGYTVLHGSTAEIAEAPHSLLAEMSNKKFEGKAGTPEAFDQVMNLHKPFTAHQIDDLRKKIEWLQTNGTLSYQEWRDGLFSLKAGLEDPEILDELAEKWTYNNSYQAGDEAKAAEIIERAVRYGPIGPGSIFGIIKDVAIREGAEIVASPLTRQEIINKSKVKPHVKSNGSILIAPTESNTASLLGAMFDADSLYHDIRMDSFVYKNEVYSDVELTNLLTPMIQSPAHGLGLENMRKSVVSGGLDVLMAARQIDPHKRWLDGLVWDHTPRIDSFFSAYVGVEDSEYTQAVSKNFWIALAARGIHPGSKFDYMVILEGDEGIRKSSLLEAIGGEYYMSMSTNEDINGVECLRKMHQSTIVELPELVGLLGKSGEEIKAVIAAPADQIRALYARKAVKKKRGFVLVGTTNSRRYLKDSMGTRRYWPLNIPKGRKNIDTAKVMVDREQLYAEAVHRYIQGEHYWDIPKTAKLEVTARQSLEPLAGPLLDILQNSFGPQRLVDLYRSLEGGGYISRGFTARLSERITSALHSIGAKETELYFDGRFESQWQLPVRTIGDFI